MTTITAEFELVTVATLPTQAQMAVLAMLAVALFALLAWRFIGRPVPPRLTSARLLTGAATAAIGWSIVIVISMPLGSQVEWLKPGGLLGDLWAELEASVWISLWFAGLLLIGTFLFVWKEQSGRAHFARRA